MRSISRMARRVCADQCDVETPHQRRPSGVGAARSGAASSSSRMCEAGRACVATSATPLGSPPRRLPPILLCVVSCSANSLLLATADARWRSCAHGHAKNIFCRVECNRRTIMRQMHKIATPVTRLNYGARHIATTGVAGRLSSLIFAIALRNECGTGLRAAELIAFPLQASKKITGRIAMRTLISIAGMLWLAATLSASGQSAATTHVC